jgi:hypothetical protein
MVIKSRRMKWTGYGRDGKCVDKIIVGRLEEKRPHGRHTRRWEDNIKVDLREI